MSSPSVATHRALPFVLSVPFAILFAVSALAIGVIVGGTSVLWVGVKRAVVKLRDAYMRVYGDELARARHICEEDARRLGAVRLPEWPAD